MHVRSSTQQRVIERTSPPQEGLHSLTFFWRRGQGTSLTVRGKSCESLYFALFYTLLARPPANGGLEV